MAKVSKKLTEARAKVDAEKFYPLAEAIKLAKETSYTKFWWIYWSCFKN